MSGNQVARVKKSRIQYFAGKMRLALPWAVAALTAHALGWSTQACWEAGLRPEQGEPFLSWSLWPVALFVGLAALTYSIRRELFLPRTRSLIDVETPEARRCLVLFLSDLATSQDLREGVPTWLDLTDNLDADIENLARLKPGKRWSWEMPLRGIRHHLPGLKRVVIVCSRESILQARWFEKIIRRYSALSGVELSVLANEDSGSSLRACPPSEGSAQSGWDFERFDQLSEALLGALKELRRLGYSERHVMVDITGGQKPTSVVAAAVTFNRRVKIQYVQTNRPWRVVGYDLMLQVPTEED